MKVAIGIDPGTNTGVCIYDIARKNIYELWSGAIHDALDLMKKWKAAHFRANDLSIKVVRVEDARQRKWYGENSDSKLKGAGSIERDSKIWEDFLKDSKIPYEMVHPISGGTKWDAKSFKQITGWQKQTNEHQRDAALLVFGA